MCRGSFLPTKVSLTFILCVFIGSNVFSQIDSQATQAPDTNSNAIEIKNQEIVAKAPVVSHQKIYKLNPAIDVPIIVVGTGWSLYAFTKIYVKGHSSEQTILDLKISNVNSLDRWAVYSYDEHLDKVSYYPFYAAMPFPLLILAQKSTRKDFFRIMYLYWEAMAVTGLIGTNATFHVDRYRPYAYRSETAMDRREGSLAKNSFYAGHVQVVAVPTFFFAKVFADYNPDSKIKWVFYGVASAATATTAYMRVRGGMHFPTDVFLGATLGALTGILVPQFHKTKDGKPAKLSLIPFIDDESKGFTLTYKPR